jgi:hypothetical protein
MRWEATRAGQLSALALAARGERAAARAAFLENLAVLRDLGALRELGELLVSMLVTWRPTDPRDEVLVALRLAGAGARLFERVGTSMPAPVRAQLDAQLAALRDPVGSADLEAALAEGSAMTWSEAVALALRQG